MGFLDVGGVVGVHDERVIAEGGAGAAGFAEQADCCGAASPGCFECEDEVGALPAGGEDDENVFGRREGFDLAFEDVLEAEVVGDAGEGGGIGIEAGGGEWVTGFAIFAEQFFSEVKGLRRGAPVATGEDFAAKLKSGYACVGDGLDLLGLVREGGDGAAGLGDAGEDGFGSAGHGPQCGVGCG